MPNYSRNWKTRTLKACKLIGAHRTVMLALITIGDWKGRSHKPYREIAELAGVSARTCATSLRFLIQKGFVLELQRGSGRRPSWLQVVECDEDLSAVVVQADFTTTKPVVVQSDYVAASVK